MHGIRRGSFWLRAEESLSNTYRQAALFCLITALAIFGVLPFLHAQTPVTVGYREFNYGATVYKSPTAEKPESKLWWNDGFWWGSLWDPTTNKYRIYRFEAGAQSWINVGPNIDDRPRSLADALWDGQKLYVASHIYAGGSQQSGNTTAANSARLYRYSYDAGTDTYSLDAGFPVLVNSAKSETLVLDKDSTGQLWVTWTQANKVYINRSLGDDLTWGTPFVLPVQGPNLDLDDISTILSFNGDRIGVMWSNQIELKVYFAVHLDSNDDTTWEPAEVALVDATLGAVADDHLNIKMMSDGTGDLFAVTKSSLSGSSSPRIYLLKRALSGVWDHHVVAKNSDDYTRPIVMLDEENRELYVFASCNGTIRKKTVDLDNINFPTGKGDMFIQSDTDLDINDPTSAKHNVNSATGLLVLASDEVSRYYLHNYIALAGSAPQYTLTVNIVGSGSVALSPAGGVYDEGTVVTLTAMPNAGYQFSSWSGDLSGSTNPATITMNADKNVTATFTVTGGSGEVVYHETATGGSSSSTTVATATSLTGVSGHLYLAAIAAKSNTAVNSVSGLGLTWTRVKAQCAGRNQTGVEVWMAHGTPSSGTVSATLASAPSNAVIAVSRYSGVEASSPIGNIVSGNTLGVNGACSGGTDNGSYSFNITTTVNGAMVFGAAAMRNQTHAPGAGYTERAEIVQGATNGSKASVAVQDQSFATTGTATVNGTFGGSVDWAVVAVEIKPQITMGKRGVMAADEEVISNQLSVISYQLEQNYPNPFSANGTFSNPSTMINFSLPEAGQVTVHIYSETGQLVRTLGDHEMAAGRHELLWNGRNQSGNTVAAGVYFYRMTVTGKQGEVVFTKTNRMTMVK